MREKFYNIMDNAYQEKCKRALKKLSNRKIKVELGDKETLLYYGILDASGIGKKLVKDLIENYTGNLYALLYEYADGIDHDCVIETTYYEKSKHIQFDYYVKESWFYCGYKQEEIDENNN